MIQDLHDRDDCPTCAAMRRVKALLATEIVAAADRPALERADARPVEGHLGLHD